MKMKTVHFNILKTAIDKTLAIHNSKGELTECYEKGNFHNSDRTKDLRKRFCFDILYGSGLTSFVCQELYPYLHDDHIYTALKAICPKVSRAT